MGYFGMGEGVRMTIGVRFDQLNAVCDEARMDVSIWLKGGPGFVNLRLYHEWKEGTFFRLFNIS